MSKAAVSRPRVYVRIRPLNEREQKEGKSEIACRTDPRQPDVLLLKKDEASEEMQVRFDNVFDRDKNQRDVFETIGSEVLRTLFSGYNASIFAYGQTGSGKTYTMEGDKGANPNMPEEKREGLIPRLIRGIFTSFQENSEITDALLEVSFVQIYQERIQDLLNQRKQLEIHMDRTSQYVARDATWRAVKSLEECMKLYGEASKMRATSATEMNLVSSRSHMILMLRMQWDEPTLPGSHAQLNMIDLAGSERLNESKATGETMMEAIHINKSLSALGNVVVKLVEQAKRPNKRTHIPYKDSKLTYLLQSSLGGSNLVHFVLAVSGSAMWRNETLSTIEFGKRALQLVLRPVRNAIDYTRLAEMEAMIERMRSHIASLEEELQTKRDTDSSAFLQLRQIPQEGESAGRRRRTEDSKNKKHLKRQTELTRIMQHLPETFDDLTSHCVLFPESKETFRELGGMEKLVHFVERSASNFYRANAAQTIASVIDDAGRDAFSRIGGLDALAGLLAVQEERCKEAACVALEAVCRGCVRNKEALNPSIYGELVDLVYGYPNQQVQEAACAAIASIVDGYEKATRRFEKLDVVPKLLETIRTCPAEVVNLTKAATNCVGRLAHGDPRMQQTIASFGGVDLLIDVLFSSAGDRDHQVPILASYALVNLCCSCEDNMEMARENAHYDKVKFRLLEGLARAFGSNAARERFGRATAQETEGPFPYYGATIQDSWTFASSGGRPIFSTFMDNPQYYLYVRETTDIAFLIQDTLYEQRMRKKRRNNSVYMGMAIFEGDPGLAELGLKQLDFHGKMVEIGRYTSNCENVLHCTLPASDTPYIVVPFTSQKGRFTQFSLSAFGTRPIELTSVPEHVGWVHTVLQGRWSEFTGRSGDGFDWRCNPQICLKPKENCRVVFVLSYRSLDQQRAHMQQEEEEEEGQNIRPRLHGRLFKNAFAPERRYLKALVPLPQGSTFVASNNFASNSYITTSANLTKGESYAYIPFTESPFQDTYCVSVYCDSDEVQIAPISGVSNEWLCTSFSSLWAGKPISVKLDTAGKLVAVIYSPGAFVRPRLLKSNGKKVGGIDSYWNKEAAVELLSKGSITIQVEAMMRGLGGTGALNGSVMGGGASLVFNDSQRQQVPASDLKFDLFVFTDHPCKVSSVDFEAVPSAWPCPTQSTSKDLLDYPRLVEEIDASNAAEGDDDGDGDGDWSDEDGDDGNDDLSDDAAAREAREAELLRSLEEQEARNRSLAEQVEQQKAELEALRSGKGISPPAALSSPSSRKSGSLPQLPNGARSPISINDGSSSSGSAARRQSRTAAGTEKSSTTLKLPAGSKRKSSASPDHRKSSSIADETNGGGAVSGKAKESIEYTLLKLGAMSKRASSSSRSNSEEDRKALLRDIEEIQKCLFKALKE